MSKIKRIDPSQSQRPPIVIHNKRVSSCNYELICLMPNLSDFSAGSRAPVCAYAVENAPKIWNGFLRRILTLRHRKVVYLF
ncbi:MAG: hypothetical protein ACTTJ1_06375 [Treponema sp.]